jgi:ATP-binding cassette, subfamily F, member 3
LTELDPSDSTALAEDQKAGIDMMETLRSRLEAMDAGSAEARARTVLLGLGFKEAQIEAPALQLSGGWRSRCDLACALIQATDVLMLDEPTNFLDLPAIIWLQRYLSTELTGKTVVVVTHDRDFADAIAQELLLLRLSPAKTLESFKGCLTEYEAEKRRQIRRMTKMLEAQDKKTKHIEQTIASNVKAAKRTGDDKKLKQAASRKKKLEERSGLEVGLNGGRFKLNRDLAGFHLGNRADIEIPGFDPPVGLSLPEQPSDLRHPGSLVSFEKVSFTYPKSGVYTLKDVDLIISPGDRVGLAGLNGSGKSTIIKLLISAAQGTGGGAGISAANNPDLRPTKGAIATHPKGRIGYYGQHAVEELEALGREKPELTALSYLASVTGPEYLEQDFRGILASLGLKGTAVSDVPLGSLSGGQRVRVALAMAVFDSPHLLILDEVTTHLDADTIVALIEELQRWKGALLVVTHDRYFMRCVVEQEKVNTPGAEEEDSDEDDGEEGTPGVVYRMFKAGLQKLEGGMAQYESLVEKGLAKRKQ